jgi:hypothetical protein
MEIEGTEGAIFSHRDSSTSGGMQDCFCMLREQLRGWGGGYLPFLLHSHFNPVLERRSSELLYRMKKGPTLGARKFYGTGTKDEKINDK